MHPVVIYLLLALCAALLGAGVWVEGRKEGTRFARFARYGLAAQLAAVVLAYFVLRPGRGDDGARMLAASVAARQPVLMDIYSNW